MQSPCSRKELSQKNRKDVGVTEAECASCMQCVEAGDGGESQAALCLVGRAVAAQILGGSWPLCIVSLQGDFQQYTD